MLAPGNKQLKRYGHHKQLTTDIKDLRLKLSSILKELQFILFTAFKDTVTAMSDVSSEIFVDLKMYVVKRKSQDFQNKQDQLTQFKGKTEPKSHNTRLIHRVTQTDLHSHKLQVSGAS